MDGENVVLLSDYRDRLHRSPRAERKFPPRQAEISPPSRSELRARLVSRLARISMVPILREVQTLTSPEAIEEDRLWTDPPLDANRLPVLLIGGLASTPHQLQLLQSWLSRLNCRAQICPIAYGVDCGERTTAMVTRSLTALAAETGRRSVLIAHSRGGQFARAAAVRHPDLVEALVTLGSPINRMLGVHPILRAEVAMLALAGSLGLPGLLRPACLWGECCRRLRADLTAPFPREVSYLSVYSRQDQMVDWRSSLDAAASHREIDATHSSLICSAAAFEVLADELSRVVSRYELANSVQAPPCGM